LPPAKSIANNKEKKYPEQEVQVLLQLLTVPKTKVFPACAVTLATKRPLVEEETLLQGGTIETSDVEFKDTFFFADVNDHCVHSDGRRITAFLYSSSTTIWQITFHSSYAVASGGRHFLINTSCFMK
jgi:hypothetical protein